MRNAHESTTIYTRNKIALDWGVPSEFAIILKRAIKAKFRSRLAFIKAAQPDSNHMGQAAHLHQILKGERPPPTSKLDDWSDALGFSGIERQRFKDLAAIAHQPKETQSRFIAILDGFEKAQSIRQEAEARELVLVKRIEALEAKLKGRGQ